MIMKWLNPEKRIKFLEEKVKDLEKERDRFKDLFYSSEEKYFDDLTKLQMGNWCLLKAVWGGINEENPGGEEPIAICCDKLVTKVIIEKIEKAIGDIRTSKELQEKYNIKMDDLPDHLSYDEIMVIDYCTVHNYITHKAYDDIIHKDDEKSFKNILSNIMKKIIDFIKYYEKIIESD